MFQPADDRLLKGVVQNAGYNSATRSPRWAAVMNAIGCGSTVAQNLCRRFDFDPDDMVGKNMIDPDELWEEEKE